jgi:excisionase family DNA binding protein
MKEEYFNVKQAAEYLTLAISTIYEYIHYRKIPFCKIGERVVLPKSELDKWVKVRIKKEVNLNQK